MLIANQIEIIYRNPRFQIFEVLYIRVDFQPRQWQWLTFKLHITSQLQLVFINMGIHNFVESLCRLQSGYLGHNHKQPAHLNLIKAMTKWEIIGALIGG